MYSIIQFVQLCDKGKKTIFASNNLEEIYKIYNKLITTTPYKLHIYDDVNHKNISVPNFLDKNTIYKKVSHFKVRLPIPLM